MAARNLAVIRMPAGIMLCHYFFECSLLGRAQQAADAQLALIQEGLYLRACFPADLADILMGFVDPFATLPRNGLVEACGREPWAVAGRLTRSRTAKAGSI